MHKASNELVTGSAALGVETLDVAAMGRGWGGKHVLRAGLAALVHCIDYKTLWSGTPLQACPQDLPLEHAVLGVRRNQPGTQALAARMDVPGVPDPPRPRRQRRGEHRRLRGERVAGRAEKSE